MELFIIQEIVLFMMYITSSIDRPVPVCPRTDMAGRFETTKLGIYSSLIKIIQC